MTEAPSGEEVHTGFLDQNQLVNLQPQLRWKAEEANNGWVVVSVLRPKDGCYLVNLMCQVSW